MTGSQSGPTRAPDPAPGPPRSIRSAAEPLVAAGLAAHGSVVGLTAFFAPPPLLTALVATLVFAGISLAYGRRVGALVGPAPRRLVRNVLADAVVLVIVSAGAWLIGRVLGTGAGFYCEPLVPWRIEIALARKLRRRLRRRHGPSAPARAGGIPPGCARAPVDCSLLRVLLAAPPPRPEPDHDVPRPTDRHGRPRCVRHVRGRATRTDGSHLDPQPGPSPGRLVTSPPFMP